MISQLISQRIRNFGLNSTSFQTLYPGYRYFSATIDGELGVIAYVDTPFAWMGASEPVISEAKIPELLEKFRTEAKKISKSAVLLPVSAKVANLVRAKGWYAVQIGTEPWYQLSDERAHPNGKQLQRKGARVERFEPSLLSVREKAELDEVTDEWLNSRKMANLSFLNRVEPWNLFHERRYFRLLYRKRQIAFLAAVPVHARNAWYFVDLLRENDSPVGTSELLVTEAANLLRKEGSAEISLGMSPFSIPSDEEQKHHPVTYGAFKRIFNHVEMFYGFKSLFQYKQKFNADRWEPQYLVCLDRSLGLRALLGLNRAMFPKGVLHTTFSTAVRASRSFSLRALYLKTLNDQIVPKSPPRDVLSYLIRCKVTLPMVALSILYFFTSTDEHFHIRPNMAARYSYSLDNLIHGTSPTRGLIDLIIASFLHWDIVHLMTNVTLFVFFVSFLECVCGSTITFFAFFSGILFSNPLTSLFMSPLFYVFAPQKFAHFLHEPDIGAPSESFPALVFYRCL